MPPGKDILENVLEQSCYCYCLLLYTEFYKKRHAKLSPRGNEKLLSLKVRGVDLPVRFYINGKF